MYIELSDILSVTNKELDIPASIEMNRFVSKTDDYEIISKSPFTVHLKNTGKKKLSISFETVVSLNIPCSRCLADVRNDIHIEVNKIIDMNESDHEEIDLDEQSFIEGKVALGRGHAGIAKSSERQSFGGKEVALVGSVAGVARLSQRQSLEEGRAALGCGHAGVARSSQRSRSKGRE